MLSSCVCACVCVCLSVCLFSAMAIDEDHEQVNAAVQDTGRSICVNGDPSRPKRMLVDPNVNRFVAQYEAASEAKESNCVDQPSWADIMSSKGFPRERWEAIHLLLSYIYGESISGRYYGLAFIGHEGYCWSQRSWIVYRALWKGQALSKSARKELIQKNRVDFFRQELPSVNSLSRICRWTIASSSLNCSSRIRAPISTGSSNSLDSFSAVWLDISATEYSALPLGLTEQWFYCQDNKWKWKRAENAIW